MSEPLSDTALLAQRAIKVRGERMSEPLLRASGMSVQRGARVVLERCDVTLDQGEVLGIYGPNGAGKSTMLQALAGLLPLATGQVAFEGKVLERDLRLLDYHRATAAVFQEPLLLHGTVWHNVTLGLRLRGVNGVEQRKRAQPWLERLKIADLAERPVRTLSGGEAQRTSLARALVLEPKVFFLDEPFSGLDAPTRWRLLGELSEILAERRIASVFVTHELDEIAGWCQRCLVLDGGRVLQEGSVSAILEQPASERVAEITSVRRRVELR